MRRISLTQEKFAIVDDEDFEYLNQYKWHYGLGYALKCIPNTKNKKGRKIQMHRLLMNISNEISIDHINGNGLDNRRYNLRICTHKENLSNQKPQIGKSSKYKGVYWHKGIKRWFSRIKVNGITVFLGSFIDEKAAARAYNRAAKLYFKEFSRLNIIKRK